MRVLIVGPGALGSVLGAALADAGSQVVFLGRPSPHLDALREDGLRLTDTAGQSRQLSIEATDDPSVAADADVIVVLVKAGDTQAAAQAIAPHVRSGQTVLTLQNGLGNAERIREILGNGPRVLPGTTFQAATRTAPGEVVHTGKGPSLIGFADPPDAASANVLAGLLTGAGWPAATTPDIERWLWHKVAVNAAINGLTALGGFTNAAIAANPDLLNSAESIAEEAASIARGKGVEIGSLRQAILETATATADNRSSMLQDIDAGRPTEVEAIHGAILAAGEEIGVDTPGIRILAALIRVKERAMAKAARNDG